jgi:hypothetical protein
MEFLRNTATFVISVLASLFTTVDSPQAQAKGQIRPEMKPASYHSVEVPETPAIAVPGVRIVLVVEKEPATNPENERFIRTIRSAPGPKAPVGELPWYLSMENKRATDAVRAVVTRDTASQ